MLSSARSFSKQVLNHRTQIQQQTKSQLRNPRAKDQARHDDDHKALMAEKMRQENRERKKRWRELNEERNKDNDLRCRVNKRANQLYGAQASEAKEKWIGEEFERRQQKRREKELRKRQQQAETVDMPTSFGSYSMLPPHQVRAANDFWRSVAASNAIESSSRRVQLPPLRSVVPEELCKPVDLQHDADRHAANVTPHMTASPSAPSAPAHRHVRPWEQDHVPAHTESYELLSRDATLSPVSGPQPDLGLSEAAFSLMSLSSSVNSQPVT
ncbi:hypothetical protein LPJ78_005014 [Coemansia sp. RSA 989]|nr:hypothetical protein BX667DRAFT_500557 [Coemansia mojavensis]KAJ1739920.1 hypothetical protein LPJ68_004236 [Coemansia sp. RSA 1086]KAJ1748373.1 hypothetical protein LPJ79_004565 [Coemansia sp. RSA 1821]KAJ1861959.1 hypothetical protein LPJ78_005014 [Coemansia sp. RSA 989]KAJ1869893.1 hypothetical protein LPJ55_005049 [Coemansia sp. RSA 990]KAJ2668015.1 hypothetical protein IWW42_005514 [Coemansia sp. RSA 1085]